jgi:hypothetical protein
VRIVNDLNARRHVFDQELKLINREDSIFSYVGCLFFCRRSKPLKWQEARNENDVSDGKSKKKK